jgi:benzylsuccinate CoA-transferase BbsF subunit
LRERERTGAGQHLDVSQIEVGVYALCESIVRFSANGEIVSRRGNRDTGCAPHGIYPCAGEDRWIAVAVRDDAAWGSFARALGDPAWMRDPALATAEGRVAGEDALDERVAAETRAHDARALMDALQAAGVEAGVVQDFRDLLDDPQLAHRGHFQSILHARLGMLSFERSGLRLSDCPGGFRTPGPDLGQHTREVLGGELGLDPAEIDRLVASGVAA